MQPCSRGGLEGQLEQLVPHIASSSPSTTVTALIDSNSFILNLHASLCVCLMNPVNKKGSCLLLNCAIGPRKAGILCADWPCLPRARQVEVFPIPFHGRALDRRLNLGPWAVAPHARPFLWNGPSSVLSFFAPVEFPELSQSSFSWGASAHQK